MLTVITGKGCVFVCLPRGSPLQWFSRTCCNKERAHSSVHSSCLHSDGKSNWLHATPSRQQPGECRTEPGRPRKDYEQVGWDAPISPHLSLPLINFSYESSVTRGVKQAENYNAMRKRAILEWKCTQEIYIDIGNNRYFPMTATKFQLLGYFTFFLETCWS